MELEGLQVPNDLRSASASGQPNEGVILTTFVLSSTDIPVPQGPRADAFCPREGSHTIPFMIAVLYNGAKPSRKRTDRISGPSHMPTRRQNGSCSPASTKVFSPRER